MSKDTEKKPTWNPEARAAALRAAAQKPDARLDRLLQHIGQSPLRFDDDDVEAILEARRRNNEG